MTRRYTLLTLVVVLAVSGCAKPDWIQQTLVTVDVTGTWVGSCSGRAASIPTVGMILTQSGSKVTGQGWNPGSSGGVSWSLEGTINGDVLTFSGLRGSAGEFQVNGDEMSGPASGIWGPVNCQLRRESSDSPRS